ncbi:MAG TPA: hypothetical protein VHQ44_01655 [Thermoanaerobaculia bacterium]|nr:hypothetical protein [Thermoanaerobaculia bacterium]
MSVAVAAESSLSILTEPHLARLRKNGFAALLPGGGTSGRSGAAFQKAP